MKRKSFKTTYPFTPGTNLLWLGIFSYILIACIFVWGIFFFSGVVTLAGVPASVVVKFIQDPTAVKTVFLGNNTELHDRLESIGIEEEIKNYYRAQIIDEMELDRYIHQIFYNWTGYIGYNYQLDTSGQLVLKKSGEYRLQQEINANRVNNQKTYLQGE